MARAESFEQHNAALNATLCAASPRGPPRPPMGWNPIHQPQPQLQQQQQQQQREEEQQRQSRERAHFFESASSCDGDESGGD